MAMQDTNGNGKVDHVAVTFNKTLAAYTAGRSSTLTNVPSAGSLGSVSVVKCSHPDDHRGCGCGGYVGWLVQGRAGHECQRYS